MDLARVQEADGVIQLVFLHQTLDARMPKLLVYVQALDRVACAFKQDECV